MARLLPARLLAALRRVFANLVWQAGVIFSGKSGLGGRKTTPARLVGLAPAGKCPQRHPPVLLIPEGPEGRTPVPPAAAPPSRTARRLTSADCAKPAEEGDDSMEFASVLHCSSSFHIREVNASALELLRYGQRSQLVGKSILELMPPAVADAHRQIFRTLKHSSPEAVCEVGKRLLSAKMSRCREFAVLDANGEAVVCSASVTLREDLSSEVTLQKVQGKTLCTVPRGFGSCINSALCCHVEDFDGMMCVTMDLAGSTRFSQSKPPRVMAELFHRMYVVANAVVLQEAFPFAYIHEIVGDSLLLLVNAGFMVRYPIRAAVIGARVATRVQGCLDAMLAAYSHEMYTRVGIAMGPVSAGVVDGKTFRIFGSTVYLSQRLESLCPRGKVACCKDFIDLLRRQTDENIDVDEVESEIKGFGTVKSAHLQCGALPRNMPGQMVE